MSSNQQADSLNFKSNYFCLSEDVKLDKKAIKSLKNGIWIEIKQEYINIDIIENKNIVKEAILISDGDYFYIKVKNSCNKKYKKSNSKESFNLKISLDKKIISNYLAISKSPLNAKIIYKNQEFAKAKLYISDNIYIEIKEIL